MQNRSSSGYDLALIRAQVPGLSACTYLNTGTFGMVAEPVLEKELAAIREFDAYAMVAHDKARAAQETARTRIAGVIGASPEEMTLTGNATDGINLVAQGLDWWPGDEVIISNQEHPAMNVPWHYLAQRKGVLVRHFCMHPDPATTLANIERLITPRTRLIGSSHISHQTGIRVPVAEMSTLAHAHGALALVDGAQSFAQFRLDMPAIDCDFYSSNGHKWLCGPKGTGWLYTRRSVLEQLAAAHVGAGSTIRYNTQHLEDMELQPSGKRFEFGTRGHAIYAGLTAALDWYDQLGWESIWEHQAQLSGYLRDQVLGRGWILHTPYVWELSAGLTCFTVPGIDDVNSLHEWLVKEHNIYIQRIQSMKIIRISTAYYNSKEDVDALLGALEQRL